MASTLADLVTVPTEEEQLEFCLTQLASEGFPVTAWDDLGVGIAFARLIARSTQDSAELIAILAKGGLLDLSEGGWLDLLSESAYGLERKAATFAVIRVRLTRTSVSGPDTIAVNSLWLSRVYGNEVLRYNNRTGGTLASTVGSTLDLEFVAEYAGSQYNVASISETVTLATSIAGTTVALQETSGGSGNPLVESAIDEETDSALRARCKTRWGTIGLQKTAKAYEFLALNVVDDSNKPVTTGATRVLLDATNPRGAGTTDIYVAGASGAVGSSDLAVIDGYLQPRKGICEDLQIKHATVDAITITATVWCETAKSAAAQTTIATLLQAYSAGLSIGTGSGTALSNEAVKPAQITELLMAPDGVVDCALTAPTTAQIPVKGHVIVLSRSLSFISV